ncbi:branched-chain amino acid ABC transporter permease [Amycolatopsis sp. NPDC005232]|uniref:branched-chain amino acid ABC transporter permease n=1 Tax=Amycolatopsis sp. NPDC005232 TaxID=3157027 RepID=UPI0033BA527D
MALLIVLTLYMSTTQTSYSLLLYNTFLFAAIGVSGLNLSMGTAGLVSVGSAAFLCVGSFVSVAGDAAGLGFPWTVVLAVAASAVFGGVFALPSARLAALYFALSTLAGQAILVGLAENYQRSKVGDAGFVTTPVFSGHGILGLQETWSWVLTLLLGIVLIGITRVRRGRAGRAWRLLRDHELAAASVGIPVARWRIGAMMLSSAIIGTEGALNYYFTGTTSTSQYTLLLSIEFVAMLLVGGIDTAAGPILGAAVIVLLPFWTKDVIASIAGTEFSAQHGAQVSQMIYGALVMLAVVVAREGVEGLLKAGWTRARTALARRRR